MATYKTHNDHKINNVVRQLLGEGCRAWTENHNGQPVLCTDASVGLIGICAGNGLWAERLFDGLPS